MSEMPSNFRLADYCPKQATATGLSADAGISVTDNFKKPQTGLTTDGKFLKYVL